MHDPQTFKELQLEMALLVRENRSQDRIIRYYKAKNYSIVHRNRHLIYFNRLLFILDIIMIIAVLLHWLM
jgi:hypothetical protein